MCRKRSREETTHSPSCIDLCYVCKWMYVCTEFTEMEICMVMAVDDPIGMDSMV